jgi:Uncharacterised protein family UPF0102
MGMQALIGYAWVKWQSRFGLSDVGPATAADRKQEALRVGLSWGNVCLLVFAATGVHVFIAKNYEPAGEKGELDLVGFDGDALAFVEVRTRAAAKGKIAQLELSIGREITRCWCAPPTLSCGSAM